MYKRNTLEQTDIRVKFPWAEMIDPDMDPLNKTDLENRANGLDHTIRSNLESLPYLSSDHLAANLDLGLISSEGYVVLVNKLCFTAQSKYAQALISLENSVDKDGMYLLIAGFSSS